MRDCRLVIDKSVVTALLLQNLTLELQRFYVMRHVIKVDRSGCLIQKLDALHSDLLELGLDGSLVFLLAAIRRLLG